MAALAREYNRASRGRRLPEINRRTKGSTGMARRRRGFAGMNPRTRKRLGAKGGRKSRRGKTGK